MNTLKKSSLLTLLMVLILSCNVRGSQRYWIGAAASNWNNTTNWSNISSGLSGFSVPGVNDTVYFNNGSMNNCAINANANVKGFVVASTYTGEISMGSGITLTIGAYGYTQASGTFIGNNAHITINGSFSLAGGSFTSTTATLFVMSGFTTTSGSFIHNNGTVNFTSNMIIDGNSVFYNLIFNANGALYNITTGTVLTSSNNLTIIGTGSYIINNGIIKIKKDLTLTSSSNHPNNGGSTTFLFDGTGTQNINSALTNLVLGTNDRVCGLPNVEINKSSGTLNLSGIINLNGSSWLITAGTNLILPGVSTVNINSSITFTGQNLKLYNIHINATGQVIVLKPATYMLTSFNDLTVNGSNYYRVDTGIIEIKGDLNMVNTSISAFNGGSATFLFDGTGTQNINSSASTSNFVCSMPNIMINKTSGALNFIGILNFNSNTWNTIAGASLINAGTSTVNVLQTCSIIGQNLSLYDITIAGNFSTVTIGTGVMWTSSHLITLAGSTSWYQINTGILNAKGNVLVTNTNTSFNVGGNAILLFDGTANQLLTGSGIAFGGRLPAVQINKTAGTLTFSNALISVNSNWNYISGNVDAMTNNSTVELTRGSILDGQGTSSTMAFNHVNITGQIVLGGNLDINGNLTISTGLSNTLDVSSANNYQINIAGNWINNNSAAATSFTQQSGKVVFDGATIQTLSLDTLTRFETFYKLAIDNSSIGLSLNAPLHITNNLNLINGKITTTPINIITLENAATATGASNSSYVSGPINKIGNQAFVFPVGKNNFYAPITISAPAINTNQFTAEYFYANPQTNYNVLSKDTSLNHISRCEYWNLTRTTGISNVIVSLSWNARSCDIDNLSNLRIASWNGSQWKDMGNSGTIGSIASGTLSSTSAVGVFGPFTLASSSINNPLPITLLTFTGICRQEYIQLDWSTASEQNNDYFTIERMTDQLHWNEIRRIPSGINSNTTKYYNYIDSQLYQSNLYYRLKQTNLDETFTYSNSIEVVNCAIEVSDNDLIIYPNPAKDLINLEFKGNKQRVNSVEIYNIEGVRVKYFQSFQNSIDISSLPNGIYTVRLNLINKSISQKFYIQR